MIYLYMFCTFISIYFIFYSVSIATGWDELTNSMKRFVVTCGIDEDEFGVFYPVIIGWAIQTAILLFVPAGKSALFMFVLITSTTIMAFPAAIIAWFVVWRFFGDVFRKLSKKVK